MYQHAIKNQSNNTNVCVTSTILCNTLNVLFMKVSEVKQSQYISIKVSLP